MAYLTDFITSRYGVRSRARTNPVTSSVGTTAKEIAKENHDRLAIVVINLSANDLYVAFDNQVSSSRGIYLTPTGGSLSLLAEEDLELTGYRLWAVASAANAVFMSWR